MNIWLVIIHDRHMDDVITAHRTRAGVDAAITEYKSGCDCKWTVHAMNGKPLVEWHESHEEGPSIDVRFVAVLG